MKVRWISNRAPLDELLLNHAEVTQQVMDEVNIVPIFRNYLEHGCYPFYWEDPDAFNFRLQDLVRDSIDAAPSRHSTDE